MRNKQVPIRTCLGCGQKREKGELVRIVIKDGGFVVDERGKLPGRGAYLCPQEGCISSLLRKRGRLSYALRVSLPHGAEGDFLRGLLRERAGEE